MGVSGSDGGNAALHCVTASRAICYAIHASNILAIIACIPSKERECSYFDAICN